MLPFLKARAPWVPTFKVPCEQTYSLIAFAALQSENLHGIKAASDLRRAPGGIRNVLVCGVWFLLQPSVTSLAAIVPRLQWLDLPSDVHRGRCIFRA